MNQNLRWTVSVVFASSVMGGCICDSGACVGTGGQLSSPECKQDWDRADCEQFAAEEINGATWSFHGGQSCEGLGYTEECSDGSFRRPGAC